MLSCITQCFTLVSLPAAYDWVFYIDLIVRCRCFFDHPYRNLAGGLELQSVFQINDPSIKPIHYSLNANPDGVPAKLRSDPAAYCCRS
mgnify:CR=1 FL=1